MEKNITDKSRDDRLRDLFAASKIVAGENLKYRVMQQIETENLLAKSYCRKEKRTKRQIGSILVIASIAYMLIVAVIAFSYLRFGMDLVVQLEFYLAVAFIVAVASLFGLISFYDEKLRAKG